MKEQLLLLSLAIMAFIVLFQHRNSGSDPLAYALAGSLPTPTNLFSNLYEKATLLFDKELTQDEVKGWFKEGFEKYKGEVKTIVDGIKDAADKKASSEEITQLKAELEKKISEVQDYAEELELKAGRLKDSEPVKGKSIMEQAEEGMLKMKEDTKAQGGLKSLPKRDGRDIEIDLKAVSNHTSTYSFPNGGLNVIRGLQLEPGVSKAPNAPLFVLDLISTGLTEKHTIEWMERILLEGGAGQVAEAAAFPQISVKWDKKSAVTKKTAAYAKITEEMLEDTDFVLTEVNDEIVNGPNSIRVVLENQLLTGDGTGENHKGLFTYATAFALPAGFETLVAPNTYDATRAAILQSVKANFLPDYMLVNPSTLANMELTKDSTGQYVIAPFVGQNGMIISGVRVASSNRVAEGSFLVGDFKRATLFMKRQLTLKMFDQNENDPIYDMRTITGSLRSVFRIKGPDAASFVKGTFAAVKTAITKV